MIPNENGQKPHQIRIPHQIQCLPHSIYKPQKQDMWFVSEINWCKRLHHTTFLMLQ